MTTHLVPTATQWLQPFSGPIPTCLVCLSANLNTEFHTSVVVGMCKEGRDWFLVDSDADPATVPDEMTPHLCRGCLSCGFCWSEHIAGPADKERFRDATRD